ncbi:MAG: diguanylate cyclase [Cystobacterineae bacterium]|nr:diguanylate cyclase [Cystobacterineae bacterium]
MYRNHVENTSQMLKQMNSAIEDQTRSQFRLVQTFLMAIDGWLMQNPESTVINEAFFNSFAYSGKFRKETGLFVDFYAIDSQGNIYNLASDYPKPNKKEALSHTKTLSHKIALGNVRDREYFKALSGNHGSNIYISAPLKGRVSEDWVIPVVLPLSMPRHGVEMLLVAIKLDILNGLYEQQRIKPSGSVVLFKDDGTLLTRSPSKEGVLGKSYPQDIEYFSQHEKHSTIWMFDSTFDGRTKLISYAPLEEFPVSVVVSVDYHDILKSFWKNFAVLLGLAVVASVAILLAGKQQMRLLAEQATLNIEVSRMATIDPLTGVLNRRRFIELMDHEFARSRRYNNPLSLLMFDLDHFKTINDTYGHQTGDEILIVFANVVIKNLRNVDFFARFGGEEFVVLLPQTPIEAAKHLAERICKIINQLRVPIRGKELSFSTSIGIAALQAADLKPEEILHRADRSLYDAKNNGRNQVGTIELEQQ